MSLAIMIARCVMVLSVMFERLGRSEADDFGGSMCDTGKFVLVGDGYQSKEAVGTVQQEGLYYAFVAITGDVG